MRTLYLALLTLALLAFVPARGAASPLFELIGGVGGLGGQQARHTGASAASAYFNPALLTEAPSGLTLAAVVVRNEYAVRLGLRDTRAEVPDGLVSATHADGSPLSSFGLATAILRNGRPANEITPALAARPRQGAGSGQATNSYELMGFVLKMFEDRVALAFVGMLPNRDFTTFTTAYADEREQFFSNSLHPELYGDRMRAISMAFAMGVRITDALSLGVGATLGLRAFADAPVFVADAGKLADVQINLDTHAKLSLVPHFGLSWRVLRDVRLTATVHAPQQFEIEAGFKFLLATGIEQGSKLAFNFDYMPWQAGMGLGWDFLRLRDSTFTATASVLYGRWSKYIDRHADRPDGAYAWRDTYTSAAGVQWKGEKLAVALDGQYKPTPVPLQTGRTNYVDNDRLGASLSTSYGFRVLSTNLSVGLQIQAHRLLTRVQRKIVPTTRGSGANSELVVDEVPDDAVISGQPVPGRVGVQTNNPGWPGFSSSGWIGVAALSLSVVL